MTVLSVIPQDAAARIAELEAQVAKLKVSNQRRATLKVSEKGALSLYGLGRFPVTLYRSQWERLLGMRVDIEAFIASHASELTSKD